MTDEQSGVRRGEGRSPASTGHGNTLIALVNAVVVGLGGVYTATQSVVISVVAAGLAGVLGVLVVLVHRSSPVVTGGTECPGIVLECGRIVGQQLQALAEH